MRRVRLALTSLIPLLAACGSPSGSSSTSSPPAPTGVPQVASYVDDAGPEPNPAPADAGEADVEIAGEPPPQATDAVCQRPFQGFDLGQMNVVGVTNTFSDAWRYERQRSVFPGLVLRATGLLKRPSHGVVGMVYRASPVEWDFPGPPMATNTFDLTLDSAKHSIHVDTAGEGFFVAFGTQADRRGFDGIALLGDLEVDTMCDSASGRALAPRRSPRPPRTRSGRSRRERPPSRSPFTHPRTAS